MKFVNRITLLLIIAIPFGFIAAWKKGWLEKAEPTVAERRIQLEETQLHCARVAAYQDARKKFEKLGAAMAHINLAKALGLTTCEVYDAFLTLVIPGGSVVSIRSSTFDYQAYNVTRAQKANFDAGVVALDDCLRAATTCFKENPWLECVKYEIRNTWKYLTPQPDYRLRTEPSVVRVFPAKEPGRDDAEFFCPK